MRRIFSFIRGDKMTAEEVESNYFWTLHETDKESFVNFVWELRDREQEKRNELRYQY